MLDKVQEFALLRARGYQSNGFSTYRKRACAQKESGVYTVRLLPYVLCKSTHFFFPSVIAIMSYYLQTIFISVMKDWADKYHV